MVVLNIVERRLQMVGRDAVGPLEHALRQAGEGFGGKEGNQGITTASRGQQLGWQRSLRTTHASSHLGRVSKILIHPIDSLAAVLHPRHQVTV